MTSSAPALVSFGISSGFWKSPIELLENIGEYIGVFSFDTQNHQTSGNVRNNPLAEGIESDCRMHRKIIAEQFSLDPFRSAIRTDRDGLGGIHDLLLFRCLWILRGPRHVVSGSWPLDGQQSAATQTAIRPSEWPVSRVRLQRQRCTSKASILSGGLG